MRSLLALILGLMALAEVRAEGGPVSEARKIAYLIRSVEQLSNAKFIRNGSAYDAQAAAEHLRRKLRAAGDRIKTAEEFIRWCGSKSSVSGEPYQIKFADGTLVTSEAFLRTQLRELEGLNQ